MMNAIANRGGKLYDLIIPESEMIIMNSCHDNNPITSVSLSFLGLLLVLEMALKPMKSKKDNVIIVNTMYPISKSIFYLFDVNE